MIKPDGLMRRSLKPGLKHVRPSRKKGLLAIWRYKLLSMQEVFGMTRKFK